MKTILTLLIILFTSVIPPAFGGVTSIEAVNKNAIAVNYESSNQPNKSKVECVLRDEIGNIVGIGMARLNDTVSNDNNRPFKCRYGKNCGHSMRGKIKDGPLI